MVGLRKLCKGDLPPVSEQKTNHKTPGNITYTLEYGARKTFQITVRADGIVSVKAPLFMNENDVKKLVECRETWIQEKLAGFPAVPLLPPLEDGSRVPFLGEMIRLDVTDGRINSARLDGKILRVTIGKQNSVREGIEKALRKWYSAEAKKEFANSMERCLPLCSFIGAPPPLGIRYMRARWGSYSRKSGITLNTRLVKASRTCIDYVMIHELCHAVHPGHGKDFRSLFGKILPDWKAVKKQLEESSKIYRYIEYNLY